VAKKTEKKKKTTGNKPPRTTGARAILCKSDEQWHAERAKGIGSSEVAALSDDKDRFSTELELWTKKTGRSEGVTQNERMYWGLMHEPTVKREYVKRTGNKVFYRPRTIFVSKANPVFRVTPDGLLLGGDEDQKVSLQIKCTDSRKGWGEEGTDQIPLHIYYAAEWELGILGPEWVRCDFAVLFSGNEFKMYYANRNETIIKELQHRADTFWQNHVLKDVPPEVSEEPLEDPKVMAAAYPVETKKILTASADIKKVIAELETVISTKKGAADREELLKNKIREFVGNDMGVLAALGSGEEVTYRWQEAKTSNFDTKLFKEKYPDLHEKFLNRGVTRSLRRYGG
jgi:putative phage-type endonuclease